MKKQRKAKHVIPAWTYVATPVSLAAMILTPWADYAKANPEASSLILVMLSIGIAIVAISIVHWVKR